MPRLGPGSAVDAITERATSLLLADAELKGPLKALPGKRVTEKDRRAELRWEIDALIALMYDLDEAELQFVLDTFDDVDAAERRGVLERYRRLAKSQGKKVSDAGSNPGRAVES